MTENLVFQFTNGLFCDRVFVGVLGMAKFYGKPKLAEVGIIAECCKSWG